VVNHLTSRFDSLDCRSSAVRFEAAAPSDACLVSFALVQIVQRMGFNTPSGALAIQLDPNEEFPL
jgi:hypothetical protein